MKFILSNQNLKASAFVSNRSSIIWQILWFQHKSSGKLENWQRPSQKPLSAQTTILRVFDKHEGCMEIPKGVSLGMVLTNTSRLLNSRCLDVEVYFSWFSDETFKASIDLVWRT